MLVKFFGRLKYAIVMFFGLVGMLVTPFLLMDIWQTHQAQYWPQTVATITYANIYEFPTGGAVFHMRYHYAVNGHEYVRNLQEKVTRKSQAHLQQAKQRWLKFKLGNTMHVFYQPTAHNVSYLSHEVGTSLWVGVVIFVMLFGASALIVFVAVSGWREIKNA